MPTKREATPEQLRKLAYIRKEFGRAVNKTYRIDQQTGHMHVKVLCAAGTWHWRFDTQGNMVDRHMSQPLPGMAAADETERAYTNWANASTAGP